MSWHGMGRGVGVEGRGGGHDTMRCCQGCMRVDDVNE